jgi:hypothetical protein
MLGEPELKEALAISQRCPSAADVECRMIDLALYEMGNVLLRSLRWKGTEFADQLDVLIVICGSPLGQSRS